MTTKKIAAAAEQMKKRLFSSAPEPGAETNASGYREYIGKTVTVRLENIVVEENVRRDVDLHSPKFLQLVESIREIGLLQNLVLQIARREGREYLTCVSGQRRLLAARAAGLQRAVCLIKDDQAADRIAIGLTENLVREDLNCIDIAEGYARLRENGWTEERIGNHYERGTRTIHRYLLIAAWPEDVKEMMREYPSVFTTRVIFNQFVSRGFKSNEDLRQAVNGKIGVATRVAAHSMKSSRPQEAKLKELAQALTQQCKLKVGIKGEEEKGTISLQYQSAKELRSIIAHLKKYSVS